MLLTNNIVKSRFDFISIFAAYFVSNSFQDLMTEVGSQSDIYTILTPLSFQPIVVSCDMVTMGGGWMVIQQRGQFGNPVNYFDRGFEEYKKGFGELVSLKSVQCNLDFIVVSKYSMNSRSQQNRDCIFYSIAKYIKWDFNHFIVFNEHQIYFFNVS